jgi:hypothetical protein
MVVRTGSFTQETRKITTAEMKYMRTTAGYIWTDYKINTQIAAELNITPVWTKCRNIVESGCNMYIESLMTLPIMVGKKLQTKRQKSQVIPLRTCESGKGQQVAKLHVR